MLRTLEFFAVLALAFVSSAETQCVAGSCQDQIDETNLLSFLQVKQTVSPGGKRVEEHSKPVVNFASRSPLLMAAQVSHPFVHGPVRPDIPASLAQVEQSQREAWASFLEYYNYGLQLLEGDSKVDSPPAPKVNGAITDPSTQKVFENIFRKNIWGNAESRSGDGSTVKSTAKLRECIGSWIHKYNVSVFLDIPCGDGNWQKLIPGIDKVSYYGYDISPSAVGSAKVKNKDMANMQYGVLDLISNDPPLKADMIMVKEVIQHLPLQAGLKMLQHAKHAGIKWLVVTHNSRYINREIPAGSWFPGPNALAPPFNFANAEATCGELDLALFDLKAWPGNR